MKTKLYSVVTLLAFMTLVFVSNGFTQQTLLEPSVRLIYFLPNDRPARPDRIEALRQLIKDAQEFYADEMERHGYGRKTFRVETDTNGEPVVHQFSGRFNENYYYEPLTDFKVWEEVFEHFNDFQHIYFIAIDLSSELLDDGNSCGLGGVTFFPSNIDKPAFFFGSVATRHRDITLGEEILGGSAIIPASGDCFEDNRGILHRLRVTTHELAHAFGLNHDFSDPDSAVGGRGFRFSECDTEWLSVSRFFNSKAVSENASGNIQLISAPTYSPEGITLRFEVTDADGLHQAQLLVPEDGSWGPWKLIGCQALDGQTQRVEFLSSELTSAPERVMLQFMDDLGNITWATVLVDIVSLLPPPKVVSIPDSNLKQAIRSQLGLASGDTLTDRAMKKLESLNVDDRKITNIAGLEYATQLRELFMGRNQIKNYDRLAELPNLTTLYLWTNNISDLSVLPILPKLEFLDLNWNHIRDVGRLAGFTNLTTLMLRDNKINDVSPLTGLVNLEVLHLKGNPIQDTSVLASLTKLRDVDIDIHQQSVPATGTWLAVEQPAGLSAANFVIKPGAFAIFVHKNQPSVSQPADFDTYRLRSVLGAADFPNLADFFQNGGRIELVSHPSLNPLPPNTRESQLGDVVISEIMWGLNGFAQEKQYIELYNASAHTYTFANGDLMFRFSKASEEPLPEDIFAPPFNANARLKVIDKVSNKAWKVPGQSGNISQNQPLISMYRAIDYTTGTTPEGTLASSWKESTGRVNLSAPSYGTPGAVHLPPRTVVQVESTDHPPLYWIDTASGTLYRLVGTEVENLAPGVRNATGLAIDMTGGKLYWIEKTGDWTGKIRRANLDGTDVQLVKDLTSVPHGIALDTANGKIYLTNSRGKVQRLNVDGSNYQSNLITGLEDLRDLAVDVVNHKVYWTEQTGEDTGRVRRADLDGSNVELV
ncbi:MAG: leucine-rich repeat domain-containing protein, partial [Candidatus Poribacteria bacterium]|nr:leucine-rich repeat domain-containing protein [Candidatus Poribacteria bacterium]